MQGDTAALSARLYDACQLAGVVRVARLAPAVIAAVARRTAWVRAVASIEQLLDLTAYAAGDSTYKSRFVKKMQRSSAKMAAWLKPPRPLSAATEATMTLEVTAEQLEAAAGRVLDRGDGASEDLEPCPAQFFCGSAWLISLYVRAAQDGLRFGAFVEVQDEGLCPLGPGQCIRCTATVMACRGPDAPPQRSLLWSDTPHCGEARGRVDFWSLGPQAGWDAGAWAAKGLLLEGGVVRVVATLKAP